MAKSVARMAVSLIANTTQFRKRMKAAVKVIKRFGRALANVAKRAVRFGAILAGVAAAGMAVMVKRAFKLNDTLGKSADILGVTTEALAELQFAGELAAIEVAQLNKGLINMVRNVVDAASGIGEAKDALEILKVDVDDLVASDPVTMFLKLADAARALGNQSVALAAFKDIFGRPGAGLSLLAQQSREELEKTFEFARRAGASIGRETARSFEDANDAMRRMFLALEGFATQIGLRIAPVVTSVANGLAEAIAGNLTSTMRGVTSFAKQIIRVAGVVGDTITGIIEEVRFNFERATSTIGTIIQGFRQGTIGAGIAAAGIGAAAPQRATAVTGAFGRRANELVETLDNWRISVERSTVAISDIVPALLRRPFEGLDRTGRPRGRGGIGGGGITGMVGGVLSRLAPPTIASGRIEFKQLEVLESIDNGIQTLNRSGGVGLA